MIYCLYLYRQTIYEQFNIIINGIDILHPFDFAGADAWLRHNAANIGYEQRQVDSFCRDIDGAFENGDNVASKLRLANKAFNHYFNRLTGLLYMGVFCLLLLPLLRLLPECWFSRLLIGICSDFPIVCLIVATAMLCPVVMKIRRKMNSLMRKLF